MRRFALVPCAWLGLLSGLPAFLPAQEYHVDLDSPRRVVFVSSTFLDEFEGVTDRLDGYALLDGDGVRATETLGSSAIYFEVDLASLDTGIGLRNRHMRENYLEVADYPFATFEGTVRRISPADGGFTIEAQGTFSVHGVERARDLACEATPVRDRFAVRCSFPVRLEDHDIEIPRIMFMKLAPEVRLELEFMLEPVAP